MRFSWDPDKSEENFRLRGFDFEFATGIFGGPTLERVDDRRAYGERRVIAIGVVQGIELTVVYTDRSHDRGPLERRIFSARRSNRYERKTYQAKFKAG
ncbi:MAG: BrnT family toxin [Gemmatimonadota bacterium]